MKLAFVREPGYGRTIWAGATYDEPGAAIIASVPSQPELQSVPGVTQWSPNATMRRNGIAFSATGVYSPDPIPARVSYIPTVHATSVRAWRSHWSPSWEHIVARPVLVQSLYGPFNVNQAGKKDPMQATVYQAGPSLGEVSRKLV